MKPLHAGGGERGALQLPKEAVQALGEGLQFGQIASRGAGQGGRQGERLGFEGLAVGGQRHQYSAFVQGVALAGDMARQFQALEQGGQGSGVQAQAVSQGADTGCAVLPQNEHHQVLRVGQAQWSQQGLVELGHGQRTGVEREAELAVEVKPFVAWRRGFGFDV